MLVEFIRVRGAFGVGHRTDQIAPGVCDLLIRRGYVREIKDAPEAAPVAPVAPAVAAEAGGEAPAADDSEPPKPPGRVRRRG